MYWEYVKGETFDKNHFYTEEDLKADNFCLNATGDGYLEYSDNIPDVLQFNFEDGKHISSEVKPLSVSTLYIDEQASFPGEKTSNVFTDKNDEFCIGNGKIAADTLEYTNKGEGYIDNNGQYRYFQKLHFSANIHKTFDNPRYPLDTAQFHVYIQPTRDSKYIRYEADQDMSGLKSYFRISSGYRLIKEKDGIKNFNVKLNYYQDVDRDVNSKTYGQEIIKTQLEVTIRANKHGFLVFVNSFLNIISVAIWLLLALYNQTYNKEDSMSMIGTGFFAAISAVLLGFSFVSGTESFALTTLINIFTMAMVLILGYESLSARRAVKLNNSSIIAYKTARVRILFYFLVACSVFMYILVPAFSYLWIL